MGKPVSVNFALLVTFGMQRRTPWHLGGDRRSIMKVREEKSGVLLVPAIALLALGCAAGAVWTAYWWLLFGLTPRPPLPPLQTALRVSIVLAALILLRFRRDPMERITLVFTAIAAGASALFGFGLRSTANDVVRLLFHLLAYGLATFVLLRWLMAKWRNQGEKFTLW